MKINDKLERMCEESHDLVLKYYSNFCLNELNENHESLSPDT